MEIRQMQPPDLARAMELHARCLPSPWSARVWEGELEGPRSLYLLAEEGPELAGQIGTNRVLDELHVTTLAVRPESRRRGIGRVLIEAALERSPGVGRVILEVREGNAGARTFYASLGFACAGVRTRYYGDEDALVMILEVGRRRT